MSRCSNNKHKSSLDRLKSAIDIKNDSVRYLEGKNGELISERTSQALTIKDLQYYGDELGINVDRLKSKVGNLKNVITHLEGELATANSGSTTLTDTLYITTNSEGVPTDTIKAKVLRWTDSYLSLNGNYFPSTSKFDFTYKYNVKFASTVFYKKDGLFKPKYPVVQLTFEDPNARIIDASNLIIIPDDKKFYQKPWFWGVLGLAGGFALGSR